jgi:hypothetical protein
MLRQRAQGALDDFVARRLALGLWHAVPHSGGKIIAPGME